MHAFRAAHPPADERAALEEAWDVVDQDGNGVVQGDEAGAMVELLMTQGEPLSEEETAEFWGEIDADGDGAITKAEFMHMLAGAPDAEARDEG